MEAIIAHEVAHIAHKDLFLLYILQGINAIFWWFPKNWWMKKFYLEQELLADQKATKWNIKPLDLASAIHKSAESLFQTKAYAFSCGFTKFRVQQLFNENRKKTLVRSLCFFYLLLGILLGNIWLFYLLINSFFNL